MEKVEVQVSGKISGYKYPDETVEKAMARLVFNAEQKVNEDARLRAHFTIPDQPLSRRIRPPRDKTTGSRDNNAN